MLRQCATFLSRSQLGPRNKNFGSGRIPRISVALKGIVCAYPSAEPTAGIGSGWACPGSNSRTDPGSKPQQFAAQPVHAAALQRMNLVDKRFFVENQSVANVERAVVL